MVLPLLAAPAVLGQKRRDPLQASSVNSPRLAIALHPIALEFDECDANRGTTDSPDKL